jgi:hypothetical protein
VAFSVDDNVIVFPMMRVSQEEFDLVRNQSEDSKEMVGYPYLVSPNNEVWPNPVDNVEIHMTEGAYQKPFFLVRR